MQRVEYMSLGNFIAKRRRILRLTQEQLADRLNVSKSAVAKWETDGGIPDRDNLKKLSIEIGVSVDDLHRIIDKQNLENVDVNITGDVIAVLKAYGYTVIPPQTEPENDEEDV